MYAHDVLYDEKDGMFKMYSCAGVAGDYIILKRSSVYENLLHSQWETALKPTNRTKTFDHAHTCDPDVFEHEGKFYLAYGGLDESVPKCKRVTRIGMAVSNNRGKSFQRLFSGKPIISESNYHDGTKMQGVYGVGQPSVVKGPDGYFYMIYSEILTPIYPECNNLIWANSNVQLHLIRSPVPSFDPNLQEHLRTYEGHQIGLSVDMAYNRGRQQLEVIVNAVSQTNAHIRIVHLTLNGDIVSNSENLTDHATSYVANRGYRIGEGVSILTNTVGNIIPWSEGYGYKRRMHLNFIVTTCGPSRYGYEHITGPVKYIRFTEGINGTLTDFSVVGDTGLIGDLDGDDYDDQVLVNTNTFDWRWKLSTEDYSKSHRVQHGLPGDIPLIVKDWNNDGKDEISVFRNGTWYIYHIGVRSSVDVINWGLDGDKPFSGDTNGDGKTELIVWRPSNGYWYINKRGSWPNAESETVQYGLKGDYPAVHDVDGNGKDDLIVWRLSDSKSYVKYR